MFHSDFQFQLKWLLQRDYVLPFCGEIDVIVDWRRLLLLCVRKIILTLSRNPKKSNKIIHRHARQCNRIGTVIMRLIQ